MATLRAGSRDATPGTTLEMERNVNTSSHPESVGSQKPSGSDGMPNSLSRGPISPPPLRRSTVTSTARGSGSPPPPSQGSSSIIPSVAHDQDLPRSKPHASSPGPLATPSPSSRTKNRSQAMTGTPTSSNCTVEGIASRLKEYSVDVRQDHAQAVAYAIESTVAIERRAFTGRDLFAGLTCKAVPEIKGQTMRIKSKQHLNGKKDQKEEHHFDAICIKTNKDAVPAYRFHHVDIKKNILAPNTMLTFVPHLRDLESSEEEKYHAWLKELEDIDLESGFKPMNRMEKRDVIVRSERAAALSLYLEVWLNKLAIPHCNKCTLIRYFASQKLNDAMNPQQRTDAIRSLGSGDDLTPDNLKAAEMFTSAFRLVFGEGEPASRAIDLRQVLSFDESADNVTDKSAAKEASSPQNDNIDEVVESNLATYCILGCLVCFSHSCDHGEFDNKNLKRTFSLSSCSPLADVLRRKRAASSTVDGIAQSPCARACYHLGVSSDSDLQRKEWTEDEHVLLRSLYITSDHGRLKMDPICLVAEFLNRNCFDVYTEFLYLDISRPQPELVDQVKPRNIAWYDRKKKMLLGDWQDHTVSHEHQRREILEPCFHDGPCAPKICSCVDADVLCERFCGCTEEICSYKFTGCGCHSQGKVCHAKQKDKPCICVQLNRECDPELCGSCGALEHADPANTGDLDLHSTGCQNCELQRGVHKSLLLGRSQLDGVGYGLFTAEDIAQDEFVIEYVGELITHDEGVRREARRGDVFDEESNISYVFTLLENEGIWVDAAIYGNLSRYINHALENEAQGCNITPRILYVNGEYRIKFTALRDIKAGEELFFNYGENFPNLTKKLLDHKTGEKPEVMKPKVGRPRRAEAGDRVARKAPKPEQLKVRRSRSTRKPVETDSPDWDEEMVDFGEVEEKKSKKMMMRPRKRKRGVQDDSMEDDYHPKTATDETSRAVESEYDSEEAARLVARRLSRKPRSHSEAEEPETPSMTVRDQPRTRMRRGEARQQSGRPKKAQASEPTQAAEASTPIPPPIMTTPTRTKPTLKKQSPTVIEIEDSEDEDVVMRNRASRTRRMPAKFRDD